jgi:hypothetical protein
VGVREGDDIGGALAEQAERERKGRARPKREAERDTIKFSFPPSSFILSPSNSHHPPTPSWERGRGGDVRWWCVVREEGECKSTSEESVVGGVKGKGFMAEGLKRVVMGHRRGREKCRKEQRAKIGRWANGRRV